jgi:NADPH-dependent curcumin reductase CurA
MPDLNRQIVLKSRPEGVPGLDNFALTKAAIPELGGGEVLMRTLYLSLDPYMRGRMSAHFPDGNASLARLLVRSLLPASAPGNSMDDIVLAPFDYEALDRADQNTRIRLSATCVNVHDAGDNVFVGYVRDGAPHRSPRNMWCLPAST